MRRPALTEPEEIELLTLLQQEERERVSPKLELLRGPHIGGECPDEVIFRGVRGGRYAGAKSYGAVSLVVQEANYFQHRYACLREVQNSLDESLYALVVETIDRLRYPGWKITDRYIESPVGSHWIFRGLKDRTAVANVKGLQNFDRFLVDEAAYISNSSIDVMQPTLFRNPGAQFWFLYNQESDCDPITEKIWNAYQDNPMARLVDCLPLEADNPWLTKEAVAIANKLKSDDPDLFEYIYGGHPRSQGERSIMARTAIRAAMSREIENPEGVEQIGVDVARFGDDHTVMYRRHGLRVVERRSWRGQDTMRTAKEAWDMARHSPAIAIAVDDTGVGGGVSDRLNEFGAKVIMFSAGGKAADGDKFANAITELWFEFPIDLVDIPDDPELMRQLEGRQYDFVRGSGQKIVESKKGYKKRIKRSPDDADALLLAYYSGSGLQISQEARAGLAARRARG